MSSACLSICLTDVGNAILRTQFYNFLPPTPTLSPRTTRRQNLEILFIISLCLDHMTTMFMLLQTSETIVIEVIIN